MIHFLQHFVVNSATRDIPLFIYSGVSEMLDTTMLVL